jgi:hypothetical protein
VSSSQLDETFAELEARLVDPAGLSAAGGDPFFYFVFDPQLALEVKRRLVLWSARLTNAGFAVQRVSFSDLIRNLIDAAGAWDEWLEIEPEVAQREANAAVSTVLRTGNGLIEQVASRLAAASTKSVVLLTEVEMLHPYFRVGVLENALHDRVMVPTVAFYPGRRTGQFGLHFLNFYPEDGDYRATVLGGTA